MLSSLSSISLSPNATSYHTQLLVKYKGDLPEKTDLHSLTFCPEFAPGPKGNNSIPIEMRQSYTGPFPRTLLSHMPNHHIRMNENTKFLYVMREPVATLQSLRRMEYLLFGPHLIEPLDTFITFNLTRREHGWLEHNLGWWSIRDKQNILIISYEEMITTPAEAVKRISSHMGVNLNQAELDTVVMKVHMYIHT
jgi:Sulfotransferase domain